jgi:phosphoglucosamine mutase
MLTEERRLFGTDGVRGKANTELTPELAMDLGRAAGDGIGGTVLVGRDTRRSGPMLSRSLISGLLAVGIDTIDAGIIPTGAVSYLGSSVGASYSVVVSASHNPAEDNGIKFFGSDGSKLSDIREDKIEGRLRKGPPWNVPVGANVGIDQAMPDAVDRYVDHLKEQMPYSLASMELVLDCANGSAFEAAPRLFSSLNADVELHAGAPDGTNINDGCGATHPEFLARLAAGRLGLAFDGDADRLVAIDEEGIPADGDVIMAVLAQHLHGKGELAANTVVVTTMSNLGFRRAMADLGISIVETPVGDRYVLEAMRRDGYSLGGEQSGHVLFEDRTTGDGLVTALRLLEVIASTGKPLSDLRRVMTEYPQVLRNVHVASRDGLNGADALWAAVAEVEARLGDEGRVLVRASGTEPFIRVMVEAATKPEAASLAEDLVAVVHAELGVS